MKRAATLNFRAVVIRKRDQQPVTYAKKELIISWGHSPTPIAPAKQPLGLHLTVQGTSCDLNPTETVNRNTSAPTKPIETKLINGRVIADPINISYTTTGYERSGFNFNAKILIGSSVVSPPYWRPIAGDSAQITNFELQNLHNAVSVTLDMAWDELGPAPHLGDNHVYKGVCSVPLTFKPPPPPKVR